MLEFERYMVSHLPSSYSTKLTRLQSEFAFIPNLHIKLSGYLNLLAPSIVVQAYQHYMASHKESSAADSKAARLNSEAYDECKRCLKAVLLIMLETFGEHRIMWASDWRERNLDFALPDSS